MNRGDFLMRMRAPQIDLLDVVDIREEIEEFFREKEDRRIEEERRKALLELDVNNANKEKVEENED